MASSIDSIDARLSVLQIKLKVVDFPNSYPDLNPVDIYRCYLAETLAKISGVAANTIYDGLQWTQSLDKCDLNLAIPRLRVKGHAPDELGQTWAENVSTPKKSETLRKRVERGVDF
jgi:arginyl-tRNA synthetase